MPRNSRFVDIINTFAYVSQKERDKMPSEDFGDPKNKRYPVKDKKHYKLALELVGGEPAATRKKIRDRILKIGERKGFANVSE